MGAGHRASCCANNRITRTKKLVPNDQYKCSRQQSPENNRKKKQRSGNTSNSTNNQRRKTTQKMNHRSTEVLKQFAKECPGAIKFIRSRNDGASSCPACIEARSKMSPFKDNTANRYAPLQAVSSDTTDRSLSQTCMETSIHS